MCVQPSLLKAELVFRLQGTAMVIKASISLAISNRKTNMRTEITNVFLLHLLFWKVISVPVNLC